jgi:2-C-methyl-D-erythritol 4-phosphate cytidylyltransferase
VKQIAIIVAGGSGKRMMSETPKQFMILKNYPVLYHTLLVFHTHPLQPEIILVLPEKHIDTWKDLCLKYNITIPHTVVSGGPTRFHSVKSGLLACAKLNQPAIVAIHDGVRPIVSQELISQGYTIASRKGSAIPVVPLKETIREVSGSFSKIVPREKYCLVQTPQFFQMELIVDSYRISYSETFTDDAGVFEASGRQVTLIDGMSENLKITGPEDLEMAALFLSNR